MHNRSFGQILLALKIKGLASAHGCQISSIAGCVSNSWGYGFVSGEIHAQRNECELRALVCLMGFMS